MEEHREKQKGPHLAFVDLETAYDRVPRQEVCRCVGEGSGTEVRIVQDMYDGARIQVRRSAGSTKKIEMKV